MSPPNLSALQNIQEDWLKMRTRKNKNKKKIEQEATLWAKKLT